MIQVWNLGVLLLLAVMVRAQSEGTPVPLNSTDICRMPMVVGNCRASFPRYYYNVSNQTCTLFFYGGCGGNNNSFNTQIECETSCAGVKAESPNAGVTGNVLDTEVPEPNMIQRRMAQPADDETASPQDLLPEMTSDDYAELCQASPKTGPCRASHKRFYYDGRSCQPFVYGGCSGNKNNYETEELCLNTCTVTVVPSKGRKGPGADESTEDRSADYHDACMVPSDAGPCRAAISKIYFDHITGTCQSFIYGGCRGNGNRYESLEECIARCTGDAAKHGGHNGRVYMTPAFFLVAVLAVISALALAGLILITLRHSKMRRINRINTDKEELLPYELPSEESLPKVAESP
ncbi:hypothetical protein UPYG_G00195160 [Umbra pygmaea]|uniref:BPTI/Kunitz inhibitor domain-containing protein n=1 Tax=Umbra pygmaea TaxID=75934 RepID=A0ABD0WIN3_UMBPY